LARRTRQRQHRISPLFAAGTERIGPTGTLNARVRVRASIAITTDDLCFVFPLAAIIMTTVAKPPDDTIA
jgi:hypothetical protein